MLIAIPRVRNMYENDRVTVTRPTIVHATHELLPTAIASQTCLIYIYREIANYCVPKTIEIGTCGCVQYKRTD